MTEKNMVEELDCLLSQTCYNYGYIVRKEVIRLLRKERPHETWRPALQFDDDGTSSTCTSTKHKILCLQTELIIHDHENYYHHNDDDDDDSVSDNDEHKRDEKKMRLPIEVRIPQNYPKQSAHLFLRSSDQLFHGDVRVIYASPSTAVDTIGYKTIRDIVKYARTASCTESLIKHQLQAAVHDGRMDILQHLLSRLPKKRTETTTGSNEDEDDESLESEVFEDNDYHEQSEEHHEELEEVSEEMEHGADDGAVDDDDDDDDNDDDSDGGDVENDEDSYADDDSEREEEDGEENINIADNQGKTALHVAVECGHSEMVQLLLGHGGKLSPRWFHRPDLVSSLLSGLHHQAWRGQTMLLRDILCAGLNDEREQAKMLTTVTDKVVRAGDQAVLNMLLEAGATVSGRDLSAAAELDDIYMIDALVNADVNVNWISETGRPSPLLQAVEKDSVASLQRLLSAGANLYAARGQSKVSVLHTASSVEAAEVLLAAGAHVNAKDKGGNTPLHKQKHHDIVELLLLAGACVNAQNMFGSTALHSSVLIGRQSVRKARLLLRHGASLVIADKNGSNALHCALSNYDSDDLEARLRTFIKDDYEFGERTAMVFEAMRGRDSTGQTPLMVALEVEVSTEALDLLFSVVDEDIVRTADNDGCTALHFAVQLTHQDREEVVQRLILAGAMVNAKDKRGRTALHRSVTHFTQTISVLVTAGADENEKDINGSTALHIVSASSQHKLSLESLLTIPTLLINERNNRGQTALHIAVNAQADIAITLLLAAGIDVNAQDEEGKTVLHYACSALKQYAINIGTLRTLLQGKASVNVKDNQGNLPLHIVTQRGNIGGMTAVLESSSRLISEPNNEGDTALHIAVRDYSSSDLIKVLLSKGASVNAANAKGDTPLHLSPSDGPVRILLEAGADIRIKNKIGQTMLHTAAWNSNYALVNILRSEQRIRVIVNQQDNNGQTALHYAVRKNAKDAVALLVEAGADPHLADNDGKTPIQCTTDESIRKVLLTRHR